MSNAVEIGNPLRGAHLAEPHDAAPAPPSQSNWHHVVFRTTHQSLIILESCPVLWSAKSWDAYVHVDLSRITNYSPIVNYPVLWLESHGKNMFMYTYKLLY